MISQIPSVLLIGHIVFIVTLILQIFNIYFYNNILFVVIYKVINFIFQIVSSFFFYMPLILWRWFRMQDRMQNIRETFVKSLPPVWFPPVFPPPPPPSLQSSLPHPHPPLLHQPTHRCSALRNIPFRADVCQGLEGWISVLDMYTNTYLADLYV